MLERRHGSVGESSVSVIIFEGECMATKKLIQWTEKVLIKKIESWMGEKIELSRDYESTRINGTASGVDFYLETGIMQHCCGIAEIGSFDWVTPDNSNNQTPLFTDLSVYPYVIALTAKRLMDFERTKSIVCSTARKVKKLTALEKIIKKVGFTRYTSSLNPKSGNIVTLWGYSKRG